MSGYSVGQTQRFVAMDLKVRQGHSSNSRFAPNDLNRAVPNQESIITLPGWQHLPVTGQPKWSSIEAKVSNERLPSIVDRPLARRNNGDVQCPAGRRTAVPLENDGVECTVGRGDLLQYAIAAVSDEITAGDEDQSRTDGEGFHSITPAAAAVMAASNSAILIGFLNPLLAPSILATSL